MRQSIEIGANIQIFRALNFCRVTNYSASYSHLAHALEYLSGVTALRLVLLI